MSETKTYQLSNKNGLTIEFMPRGAKVISVQLPDTQNPGKKVDVMIGYDTVQEAIDGDAYIGAICGRFANRIAKGHFVLDGREYQLALNDGQNHLHGGPTGFNSRDWDVKETKMAGRAAAYELTLFSPDGDENYPGNLNVKATHSLTDDNEFIIDFEATTDKPTVINLTSHPYLNMRGAGSGPVFSHQIEVNAKQFTPIADGVPSGEIRNVEGTPMDLRKPVAIGDAINTPYEQIQLFKGFDHNWIIDKPAGEMGFCGRVTDPESGRFVEVYSTQPGLQVYTAMHFNSSQTGKGGRSAHTAPWLSSRRAFPMRLTNQCPRRQFCVQAKFTVRRWFTSSAGNDQSRNFGKTIIGIGAFGRLFFYWCKAKKCAKSFDYS